MEFVIQIKFILHSASYLTALEHAILAKLVKSRVQSEFSITAWNKTIVVRYIVSALVSTRPFLLLILCWKPEAWRCAFWDSVYIYKLSFRLGGVRFDVSAALCALHGYRLRSAGVDISWMDLQHDKLLPGTRRTIFSVQAEFLSVNRYWFPLWLALADFWFAGAFFSRHVGLKIDLYRFFNTNACLIWFLALMCSSSS